MVAVAGIDSVRYLSCGSVDVVALCALCYVDTVSEITDPKLGSVMSHTQQGREREALQGTATVMTIWRKHANVHARASAV